MHREPRMAELGAPRDTNHEVAVLLVLLHRRHVVLVPESQPQKRQRSIIHLDEHSATQKPASADEHKDGGTSTKMACQKSAVRATGAGRGPSAADAQDHSWQETSEHVRRPGGTHSRRARCTVSLTHFAAVDFTLPSLISVRRPLT